MSPDTAPCERSGGFIVSYEERGDGVLTSRHFPDVRGGELGIATLEEAWSRAGKLAAKSDPDRIVNIYVCSAIDFVPEPHYRERIMHVYPTR